MELRLHLIRALSLEPFTLGEPTLAQALWEHLPASALLIMDRGFIDYGVFYLIQSGGDRHWLTRARAGLSWKVLQTLEPGDELVEVRLSPTFRVRFPAAPLTLCLRAIAYQRPGFRPQMLLTSLLDPQVFPRPEIAPPITSAGRSNSASMKPKPTPSNGRKLCARRIHNAWRRKSGAWPSPTTSSVTKCIRSRLASAYPLIV